jgi:quercetin dioxygenase-like cupin family protein
MIRTGFGGRSFSCAHAAVATADLSGDKPKPSPDCATEQAIVTRKPGNIYRTVGIGLPDLLVELKNGAERGRSGTLAAPSGGGHVVVASIPMDIKDLRGAGGRVVTAYASKGLTAEALVRSDAVSVTVLRVAAGGEVGRHSADVDQLLLVVFGRGSVRGGDGPWEPVEAGQIALWPAGEDHATRADEDLTAYVLEAAGMLN